MEISLSDLSDLLFGEVVGDSSVRIRGVSGIREAKKGDITFLANSKYTSLINQTKASAIITGENTESNGLPAIQVKNPDLAFARVVDIFTSKDEENKTGISPKATIGENVTFGNCVTIMDSCVIEKGSKIGDRVVIFPSVFIGRDAEIGDDTILYPNVVIRERVIVGKRVIIHSGAVIGCDGFGYATVKGVHHKIPQIGTVEIEDDVEVGANSTIDRARFDRTLIKKGTKIDNLVQIAHNVTIGENTFVVAQTAIGGSANLGNNVILAGQSGVAGHLIIGDNVTAAARTGITKDIEAGKFVSGFPAQANDKELKEQASLRKLPDLMKEIKELRERVKELEALSKND